MPILVTVIVSFLGPCNNLKFYECTMTSVRTVFITNLQSTIFKHHIYILLSHYPEWEHELLIMASLFPFSRILWNFEIDVCTLTDIQVWIRYCPTAHNFSCILFIVITAIGLNQCINSIDYSVICENKQLRNYAFLWSWSYHVTLNLHFRHQYLSWKPYAISLFEHFWCKYLSF